jgi:nicotinamide riboside kinase
MPEKIIVTGPECSGKTTLARALADHLGGKLVPEVSRAILSLTSNRYEPADLARMASYQQALENAAERLDQRIVICDSSALEYKIWLAFRFGDTNSDIDGYLRNTNAFFLLCEPLSHYEPDTLRVNPYDREVLFELYHQELIKHHFDFLVVPDLPLESRLTVLFSSLPERLMRSRLC